MATLEKLLDVVGGCMFVLYVSQTVIYCHIRNAKTMCAIKKNINKKPIMVS